MITHADEKWRKGRVCPIVMKGRVCRSKWLYASDEWHKYTRRMCIVHKKYTSIYTPYSISRWVHTSKRGTKPQRL